MNFFQGTIFGSSSELLLKPIDAVDQFEYLVTDGEFLVSDGSGGYEEFIVGELSFIFQDEDYEPFTTLDGAYEVSDGNGAHEIYGVLTSKLKLGIGSLPKFTSVEDHVEKYTKLNSELSGINYRPPGRGPITAIIELDGVIYVARTLSDNSGAQFYKSTDLLYLREDVKWEPIDMGYEVGFSKGTTEPLSLYARQFLDAPDVISEPIEDKKPTKHKSIATVRSVTGSGTGGSWSGVENLYAGADGGVAQAFRNPVANSSGEHFTETLQLRGFVGPQDADPNIKVEGFSVSLTFEQTVYTGSSDNPYGLVSIVKLLNVGGSDNRGSTASADRITMTQDASFNRKFSTGEVTEVYGGPTDTWNATSLDTSDILNEEFGVEIEMGAFLGLLDLPDRRFVISECTVTVHFEDGSDRIFFWDGELDVASAQLVSTNKTEGTWALKNVSGYFTLYDVVNPNNIIEGLEIRSATGGSGSFIGQTSSDGKRNLLPSWDEMAAVNSRAQHIKANFFIDESKEAVYGVTGAGPAYTYDGKYFRKIHAPVPLEKDTPRHIAEHESHLVLAYPSGSILISAVGQPSNLSGLDGAVEFGFGDPITDLVPLTGSALGVLCRKSSNALVGNIAENFTTQTISETSGAIEYSAVIMDQPIYADFRGISSIANTNQYGDFSAGRLSQRVTKLVQGRTQNISGISIDLQDIVCAIPVRNKNQYRLYFNDGFILTMTMFGAQDETPVFTVQKYGIDEDTILSPTTKYVPTASISTVFDNGAELIMIGTASGDIYVVDEGTGILTANGIENYYAALTFNPFNGGEPHTNLKFNEILIHGQTSGGQELVTAAGVNYLIPDPSTQTDEITMGSLTGDFYPGKVPQKKSTHLPNVTSGFSLKIETQADGNIPHSIQALTFRPTLVGDQSNGQKRYVGPVDTDI